MFLFAVLAIMLALLFLIVPLFGLQMPKAACHFCLDEADAFLLRGFINNIPLVSARLDPTNGEQILRTFGCFL